MQVLLRQLGKDVPIRKYSRALRFTMAILLALCTCVVLATTAPAPGYPVSATLIRPRVYIAKADITGVSPEEILPNQSILVDLTVDLAGPVPAKFEDLLDVYLDGTRLITERPSGLKPTNAEPSSAVSSSPAQSAQGIATGITLFARAPEKLAPGKEMILSVYSELDGRDVASVVVKAGSSSWLSILNGTLLAAASGTMAFLLVLAFAFYSQRVRLKIRTLESTVKVERRRLGEFAGSPKAAVPPEPVTLQDINVPSEISDAFIRGELALVVGSGISAQAGLPTSRTLWLDVLDRLEKEIPSTQWDLLRETVGRESSEGAVEALLSLVPRKHVIGVLSEELSVATVEPCAVHRAIADSPIRIFVDTTWDSLMQRSLRSREAETFTTRTYSGIAEAVRSAPTVLLKPGGDLSDLESIALTQQEFRRNLARAPEFGRTLSTLFSSQTLLFLGLSVRDIDQLIAVLPPELELSGRQHYALIPYDRSLELWEAGTGKRCGIRLLPFAETADLRQVTRFVNQLVERSRTGRFFALSGAQTPSPTSGIGSLRSLSLRNIGNFSSLDLELNEHWNLFLGDNGGGKSTILRAVALALAGNDSRGNSMAGRLLRTGENSGSIEVVFDAAGVTKVRTELFRDGKHVRTSSPPVTPLQAGQALILGFPALRGVSTSDPRGPRQMDISNPSVDDLAPLLEDRVDNRLNELKQWVVNMAIRSEPAAGGRDSEMFSTFKRLIAEMVPGHAARFSHIDKDTWSLWFEVDHILVRFDSLSQGTSAILNWMGLLLQRLYDVHRRAAHPEKESAVILIDEIDAHLHPRWQRKLVSLVREAFPNIQMLASSHSPLLAGAMERAELHLVERDPDKGQSRVGPPREDLSGQRVDHILTSSLFDLPTTRSPEAEEKIKGYFALFEKYKRTPQEEIELHALEVELDKLNYGPSGAARKQQAQLREDVATQFAAIPAEMAVSLSRRLSGRDADSSSEQTSSSREGP